MPEAQLDEYKISNFVVVSPTLTGHVKESNMYPSCDFCHTTTEHLQIIAVPEKLNRIKSSIDGFPPYTHNSSYICCQCLVHFVNLLFSSYVFEKQSGALLEEFYSVKNPKANIKTKCGVPTNFPAHPKNLSTERNFDMDTDI